MRRWLGVLLVVLGVALVSAGIAGLRTLLGAPLDVERAYLARTLFPGVGGVWAVVLGVYALTR